MKLCMFSPRDMELERGWPGRIDGERVMQLAAQTLQAFFTGGGGAREHADYALDDVVLRAPVLHPPSIRIFGRDGDFVFANPAAIRSVGEYSRRAGSRARPAHRGDRRRRRRGRRLHADGRLDRAGARGAKARDFAPPLGPVVTTPEECDAARRRLGAARRARGREHGLYPGDLIVR